MITVLSAGDFSTVQDAGRSGYQAWGMRGIGNKVFLLIAGILDGADGIFCQIETDEEGKGCAENANEQQTVDNAAHHRFFSGIIV